ncbi:hypothetical protein FQZ97_1153540 [compost metagenome]
MIRFQAFQAGFDRAKHGLAAVAGTLEASIRRVAEGEFGGQDDVVAVGGDEVAKHRFRLTKLVLIGRIDEVATGFAVAGVDLAGFFLVGAITPALAEVASTQGE